MQIDPKNYKYLKFARPKEGLLEVILSAPGKLNAVTVDGHAELARIWADIDRDESEHVPGLELHLVIGHATCPDDGATTDALYAAAQRRMYPGAASQAA